MKYACKLSKELENSIKIQVGQVVLELLINDQNNILTVLIHNLIHTLALTFIIGVFPQNSETIYLVHNKHFVSELN